MYPRLAIQYTKTIYVMCRVLHKQVPKYICESHFRMKVYNIGCRIHIFIQFLHISSTCVYKNYSSLECALWSSETDLVRSCAHQLASLTHSLDLWRRDAEIQSLVLVSMLHLVFWKALMLFWVPTIFLLRHLVWLQWPQAWFATGPGKQPLELRCALWATV